MLSGNGIVLPKDERKLRLQRVLAAWRRQLSTLEASAVMHFQEQNLDRISSLLSEKRRIESRIARLNDFIARYLP